jgi:TolB-like protein
VKQALAATATPALRVFRRIHGKSVRPQLVAGPRTRAQIVVMPLVNLSGEPANDNVAGSLTELLVANLALLPPLRVIERAPSLAASCNVEGAVLQLGNQLHIAFRLVNAATDMPLLTRTYTGQIATIRRMRAAIAWTIADEIHTTLEQRRETHLHASAS